MRRLQAWRQQLAQDRYNHLRAVFTAHPGRRWYVYGDLDRAAGMRPGTLYPTLACLERDGVVVSGWEPAGGRRGGAAPRHRAGLYVERGAVGHR